MKRKLILLIFFVANIFIAQNTFAAPADDFVTTWKTDNPGTSSSTEITIPTVGSGYNYDVDWNNDGVFDEFGITGAVTHDFGTAGTYTIRIQGSFPRIYFNAGGDRLKILDVEQWGTGSWTSMGVAFSGAQNMVVSATDTPDFSAVTDFTGMFRAASVANPDTSTWDTSAATDMDFMFYQAFLANPDTSGWDTSNVVNMRAMFRDASAANPDTSGWNTDNVTDMAQMFFNASSANPDTSGWNTSNVTTMSELFRNASLANPDTSGWNTSNVTNMNALFSGASVANPDTSGWDTSNVTQMSSMFLQAVLANPDTSGWDTSNVSNMGNMFRETDLANPDTSTWDTSNVTNMTFMFYQADSANPDVSSWDVSSVTNMSSMFRESPVAVPDTSAWSTSSLITTFRMFEGSPLLNPDVSGWDTSSVVNMGSMFRNTPLTNPDTSGWDTSGVTNMSLMFTNASSANPDTSGWDVSGVTNMFAMFSNADAANPDVSSWNTSSVNNMDSLFQNTLMANPDVSSWNTSSVTDMKNLFRGTTVANPDVSSWDTSNVTEMNFMFYQANAATPDVSSWDTSSLIETSSMFREAPLADPEMGGWDVSNVTDMNLMFNGAAMSRENFDAVLVSWSSQTVLPAITFDAGSSVYCAEDAYNDLTNPVGDNWNIISAGLSGTCPPEDPAFAPDMTAATDSGSLATDNITNDTTPDFDVVCTELGNTMTLYTDNPAPDTVIGTQVCTSVGTETITASILSSGSHSVSYTDAHMGLTSGHSPALGVVVDTVNPNLSVSIDTITNGIDDPIFTFSGTDDNGVDFFDVNYNLDNAGPGVGASTTDSPVLSPLTLDLDPDEPMHTVVFTVYDLAGNTNVNTLIFPPVVNITAPTVLSSTPITDATVTISTPTGNDIDNIILAPGTTGSSLGSCTGFGGDVVAPYAQPVTCIINSVTSTGTLTVTAEDVIVGAIGQNNQSFTIDTILPSFVITAPTKSSAAAITDTTIRVNDADGLLAADVIVDPSSTVSTSSFSCTQTTATQVDCTISIDASGDLVISANDQAGNTGTATEANYIIDTAAPVIIITAPTKTAAPSITDTTIQVTDLTGVNAADVSVDLSTTVARSGFVCTQTTATQVDCVININSSGDLVIHSEDVLGNSGTETETAYVVDTGNPVVSITAPTSSSSLSITDTTIQVTDDLGLLAADVIVDPSSTVSTSSFSCTQTTATQVDCTISIDASGDLVISANDQTGNTGTASQFGYSITTPPTTGGGGSSSGGSSVRFVCKDPAALNYSSSSFGRHKDGLCEYETKEPTEDNPFGGERCSNDLIVTDNMKNGDTDGFYGSYNRGVVTQIHILQTHMNRLLLDEYGNQAAGPVDGIFRSLTERGVRRLQQRLNQLLPNMTPLVIDGIVGPFTKAAINNSCAYHDAVKNT